MLRYLSNKGGGQAVDFETAILDGFASDGGLYVPEYLPQILPTQLESWKHHSYQELVFEITSLFIDRTIISAEELKDIIKKAYSTFEKEEIIPLYKLKSR